MPNPLLDHFEASVAAVHQSPAARSKAPLYRGMIWGNDPLPQRGDSLCVDRPTSASARPEQCFAGRVSQSGRDYDLALQVHDGPSPELRVRAIDVAIFHPVATLGQEESLLLPGQQLVVADDIRQEEIRRRDRLVVVSHCMARRTGDGTGSPQAASL